MRPFKFWIIIILLSTAIVLSFTYKRPKYKGTGFISRLEIPSAFDGWRGKDITADLQLDLEASKFGFLSDIMTYQYVNGSGQSLLLIILDAGNFHHPNVCYTSAGFRIKELDDTEFNIAGRTVTARTLYTERGTESYLSFYWIVIDKKIVNKWIEQKLKQLYFTLFNKKRIGLMVRIDIPARESEIPDALILARQFVNDFSTALAPEPEDYLFGTSGK